MLSYLRGLDWNLKPDSATVNIHNKGMRNVLHTERALKVMHANVTSRKPVRVNAKSKPQACVLQISSLSSTNAWSELLTSLTHFRFFISQQCSSFLLSESS